MGIFGCFDMASFDGDTVAWFTSTRTFTSQAGKFAVSNLEGNLACSVPGGTATSVNANGKDIDVDSAAVLGDASFNHVGEVVYTDVPDANTFQLVGGTGAWGLLKDVVANPLYYGAVGTQKYYYAATWQYTFTYTFVGEQTNMNLYFNVSAATKEYYKADGSAHGEEALNTAQGFRLGFCSTYDSTSHKRIVWAPFRQQGTWDHDGDAETAQVKSIRYVNGTAAGSDMNDYTADGTGTLLDSAAAIDLGDGSAAKAATLDNCLGVFTKPVAPASNTVQIEVRMTAWFEGTDASIVTSAQTLFQQVSATLPFTVRKAA